MKEFFNFLKGAGIIVLILCVLITCIGAFSTKDAFFIVTGVITLILTVYLVYKFIRKHSGGDKK